jgi:peptidyl-prolyl cis-trans isomerase C
MARSRSRQNQPLGDCKAGLFDATVRRASDGRSTQDQAMISLHPLPRSAPRRRSIPLVVIAALLLVLPTVAGCSKNSSSETQTSSAADPVVARVNGVDIKESDLALAEEDLGADAQAASPEAKREHLISYLADIIMVTQAADKKKLADSPEFKRRLAFLRNKLLMGYELQDEAKSALTDEALHQTYDEAVKSMGGQEEVRARHILVETEDEAKALLDQIKGGADFATLAKEKSKDPGAAEGGDLGYFTKDQMVPEFAEVAFKMYPGQLSNPVKTQFGWHIIKVEDKRTKQPPEFEKVKDQIEAYLARKSQSEFISKLRQSAKIERLDKPADKPTEQNKN